MGRASITGESGEGLYTISLDYGSERIAAEVAELQSRIDALTPVIEQFETQLAEVDTAILNSWATVDAAIAAYADDPSSVYEEALTNLTEEALKRQQDRQEIEQSLNTMKLERRAKALRRDVLNSEQVTETRQVWCADYTEEATGEVATIEVNGEGPGIIIAPGARAPTAEDGALLDRLAVTASAAYLNAALLPGWQRWRPTYRVGVLAGIDRQNNVGTVTLDNAKSSAQELPINASASIQAPFEYMSCNHNAFAIGDRVVVQFAGQSWENPKIIGFESNPRACGFERIWIPIDWASVGTIQTISGPAYVPPAPGSFSASSIWTNYLDKGISKRYGFILVWETGSGPAPGVPPLPTPDWQYENGAVPNKTFGQQLGSILLNYDWSGLMASESGSGEDAQYYDGYTIDASPVTQTLQVSQDAQVGSSGGLGINIAGSLVMTITDALSWLNASAETLTTSFVFSAADDDGEAENAPAAAEQIAEITRIMADRFGPPLSEVSVTDPEGGVIVYEFERYGNMNVGPASNGQPDSHPGVAAITQNPIYARQGPALIYRRKR